MINVVQQPSPQQLVHQSGVPHPNGPTQQQQVALQQQLSASHQQQLNAHQLQHQQVVGGNGGVVGIQDVDGNVVDASGIVQLTMQTPPPPQMLVQPPVRKRNPIQIINPETGEVMVFKAASAVSDNSDVSTNIHIVGFNW